jgi:adenylate cyclase
MADEGFKRKLAAILSADVEGYSRLMDDDEEATVRTLTSHRNAIIDLVQQFRGRVVDSPGDNILAEFSSVVDAVNCAVEIQRELAERNAELPDSRKMEFRIGVNLGDVIVEGDRIYGDGVNIAARVEAMAEAGGICITGRAYDQVANKLGLEYENLGKHQVKNIKTPIRVYRVLSYPGAAAHRVVRVKEAFGRKWRLMVLALSAVLVICLLGFYVWVTYFRLPSVERPSDGKTAFELSKGPSVAVLPFVNMSKNQEEEYFSDGLTKNIITGISSCPKLFVIAHNSTFAYKNRPVKIQKVAGELKVQYILEGSVQKENNRVRITAQLIDATSGHHLWAEKYDRDLKDIFALQDDITIKIIKALRIKLTDGEQDRLRFKSSANLEAFLKTLKALDYIMSNNRDDNVLAQQELKDVIAMSPKYSEAYVYLAFTHINDLWYGAENPIISYAEATKSINIALQLDKDNYDAYIALGYLYLMRRQHEKAIASVEHALTLNTNGADAYSALGYILFNADQPAEAVQVLQKAILLNPIPPGYYYLFLGHAFLGTEHYKKAVEAYRKAIYIEPNDLHSHLGLAAAYIFIGRYDQAHDEALKVLSIDPKFSSKKVFNSLPHKNELLKNNWYNALRKAGLPE